MNRDGTARDELGDGGRGWRRGWLVRCEAGAIVVASLCGPGAGEAAAQASVRDRTAPIVTLDTGGHHAPVRALIFTPDGTELISGGFDKVVCTWSIRDGRPERTRTIRPPIWRGMAGAIYALALSPPLAEDPQQRLLAVAGFGVDDRRGNIALYRFPGRDPRPTGDLLARLNSGRGEGPRPSGHGDTVTCLAFSPDGRFLVSGGNDARVLIWDVAGRQVVGELAGHAGPVNALAFTPKGRLVLTAGTDGVLRLFDFAGRRQAFSHGPSGVLQPPPAGGDPEGLAIHLNNLAVDPHEGRWVAIGRENGQVTLCEVTSGPSGAPALHAVRDLATGREQGAVEALAFSPDGTRLASSIVHQRLRHSSELPPVLCDVEIRDIADDRGPRLIHTETNLVYALAFRPDGRRLAYAGGDAQAVTVADLDLPDKQPLEWKGQGASIWDVGFGRESRSVGFSRRRPERREAPDLYEGFNLSDPQRRDLARGDLARALESLDGWEVRPIDPTELAVLGPDGQERFRVRLDPRTDRRWWCYSFIPKGPGHAEPTLAVGCEAGVAFYRLDGDHRRTRLFAGHNGPVYALAPSPDGRWLVTGSSDQTVRIWRLAGCDRLPPLGASFEKGADGSWSVAHVVPLGFADAMGLNLGDVVERCGVGQVEEPPGDFLPRVDSVPPNEILILLVRRQEAGKEVQVALNTTRRDGPALSLFPGLDGEWVLWMPQGYYAASVDGDRRYLGWHLNGKEIDDPTDYFTADKFPELRQVEVLTTLMAKADLGEALRVADVQDLQKLLVTDTPAAIWVIKPDGLDPGGSLATDNPTLEIGIGAEAKGVHPLRYFRLLVDGRMIGDRTDVDPPQQKGVWSFTIPLPAGRHRVSVFAISASGRKRGVSFDVDRKAIPAPDELSRLVVLAVGVGGRYPGDPRIPAFQFADRDARDLASFLAREGRRQFKWVEAPRVIAPPNLMSPTIRAAFDALPQGPRCPEDPRPWGPGDGLVVILEAHLLASDAGHFVLGTDADDGFPPRPALSADKVADILSGIAATGCRVLLLVDGLHEGTPDAWDRRLDAWIRRLCEGNVTTFVASNQGPSRVHFVEQHRAFAQGVLDATTVRAGAVLGRPATLKDLHTAVVARVRELTVHGQHPYCYIPETISSRTSWMGP